MYEPLKGFRDFYPAEMGARRWLIDTIERVARQYGFREVGTPALERTQLYIDKSGPEIVDELYSFTDKGNRSVALTPELTPTVARMVAARHQELSKPIKWFSTRPFWRYEEPQQARYREFYQTNIDIFGSDSPRATAEILACSGDILEQLGLTDGDFEFRISHRDILERLIEGVDPSADTREAIRAIDRTATDPRSEQTAELIEAGLQPADAEHITGVLADASKELDVLREEADDQQLTAAVDDLEAVLDIAADYGVDRHCRLSLSTARGLDYYTGVVFECFDTQQSVSRAVFGGGRYDDLIESVGGPAMPAVGVAPGLAALSLLLKNADQWPGETHDVDYYVLQVGQTRSIATTIAQELRRQGHIVETDVANRSFGGQLDYADSIGAEQTLIVGERDLENDEVTLKDMATGEQTQRPVDDFLP